MADQLDVAPERIRMFPGLKRALTCLIFQYLVTCALKRAPYI